MFTKLKHYFINEKLDKLNERLEAIKQEALNLLEEQGKLEKTVNFSNIAYKNLNEQVVLKEEHYLVQQYKHYIKNYNDLQDLLKQKSAQELQIHGNSIIYTTSGTLAECEELEHKIKHIARHIDAMKENKIIKEYFDLTNERNEHSNTYLKGSKRLEEIEQNLSNLATEKRKIKTKLADKKLQTNSNLEEEGRQ